MFNNYVNASDFRKVLRKIRYAVPRVFMSARQRTVDTWDRQSVQQGWTELPGYRERFARMVSGDESVGFQEFLVREYFPGRRDLVALSVGCGRGVKEIAWARAGAFAEIRGIDMSEQSIREARENAQAEGLSDVLRFEVADVGSLADTRAQYELVIVEQALHHFSPVEDAIDTIARLLPSGGMLFINEYVGPNRFQWTPRQLKASQELLSSLPERCRIKGADGSLVERVWRPSRLSMILSDPSEAIESERILSCLAERFETLTIRPFGGTVLHLVFTDMAQNLAEPTPENLEIVARCYAFEDEQLANGLPSDFIIGAFRKPQDPPLGREPEEGQPRG